MSINLQSLSITSAFNSIVNFFRSQENNGKWKDLTVGAEGSFLIRLLANIFSTLSYRIVAQSRENYLSTAMLESSCIGMAVNLGYSVFRGSNLKRLINITPNGDYTLPKFSLLGAYNDSYDILTLDDTVLKEGEPIDLRVVIGKLKEETFITGTSAVKCFTLFTTGISEDYALFLESTEVPTTKVIKQMTEDKYLVRTNPYSSVDVMYLNTSAGAKYVYGTGSEITIKYVELADVPVIPFTDSMFTYGTLNNVKNISLYIPFEKAEQIKINAPLDHETQNLIRSKQDYANRMTQIVPAVNQSSYTAITPTYTLITYLKNDFTLLTENETLGVKGLLKEENFFGTPLPDITPPRREVANLLISIALLNKYKNIADINEDIKNLLSQYYEAKLGDVFNTFELERKIENLSYVKYARVSHVVNTRKADTTYQLGYILNYGKESYIASKILGLSGGVTPAWNLPVTPMAEIDTGLETIDGSIVWKAYKRLPNMPTENFEIRQDNTQYGIGDYVYDDVNAPNYMFKCVDLMKNSGFVEPNITYAKEGEFFVDGSIIWVVCARSDTYPLWSSSTTYRLGDKINVTNNASYSLECISYAGTAGTDEDLNFELPIYDIVSFGSNFFNVAGNKTFYFRKGDIIMATYPEGASNFAVVSSVYDGTNTIVTVSSLLDSGILYDKLYTKERGTRDGQILWTLVEDPTNITYPWNSYVVFDHELQIID